MIKCKICDKMFSSYKAISSHIRQTHKISSKQYYDLYIKQNNEGICLACGKETSFIKLTKGYRQYCSTNCASQCQIRRDKISNSLRSNEEFLEQAKQHIIQYNKSDKGRQKSAEVGKLTGKKALKKAHEKYDGEYWCENCQEITKHIIGIGCISCFNKANSHKTNIIQSIQHTYGEQYTNVFQVPEIKDKIKETSLNRYNCENPGNSRNARIKAITTMRGNGNYSLWEDYFENELRKLNIQYEKQHIDYKRYPFSCDFYLPDTDTFIEINGFWTHGQHFFDKSNKQDLIQLDKWKRKAEQGHRQYKNAVDVWTIKDQNKLNYAVQNNLNYVALFTYVDMLNYLKQLKIVNGSK